MPEISRFYGIVIYMFSNDQKELKTLWEELREGQPVKKIEPLK
jgi:hypothetical protein